MSGWSCGCGDVFKSIGAHENHRRAIADALGLNEWWMLTGHDRVRDERAVGLWQLPDLPPGVLASMPSEWFILAKGQCRWCGAEAYSPRATWCGVWREPGGFWFKPCLQAVYGWWWSASALRRAIFIRDDFTCQECRLTPVTEVAGRGVPSLSALHADHIVPLAAGGKTTWANLRTLCARCNLRKGARPHVELDHQLSLTARPTEFTTSEPGRIA